MSSNRFAAGSAGQGLPTWHDRGVADITGVRLKLSRGLEHLMALDDAIATYLDGDPVKIIREIDSRHPGRVVLSLALKIEPPKTLSAVIGDCVHNLRTALDHLAWQLVVANGGVPREGEAELSFPLS